MIQALQDFHFLRPWWLLASIPAVGVWLMLRAGQDPLKSYRDVIAPHLLEHLVVGEKKIKRLQPMTMLLPLLLLIILALAGPSWQVEPSPFAEEQAALMIVLKVTPTMEAKDVQPTRLERSKLKLHDLVGLRSGSPMGLVAYSGSAHIVMPVTKDGRVVEQMADALDPSIMPVEGDALIQALEKARDQFERRELKGSILVVTDGITISQVEHLKKYRSSGGPPAQILAAVGSRKAARQSGVDEGAKALGAEIEYLTADKTDVENIQRRSARLAAGVSVEQDAERWRDGGYLLLPLIGLLALMWSRKGFSIRHD